MLIKTATVKFLFIYHFKEIKDSDKIFLGRIDQNEFLEIFFPSNKVSQDIKYDMKCFYFINKFDRNRDGFIDQNEFCNCLKLVGERHNIIYTNAQMAAIFKYYDSDGDGKISIKEFLAML